MSDKYTPGPWQMIYKNYDREPRKICIGVGKVEKLNGGKYTELVCNSILPNTDKEYLAQKENIEADMRLIASAPEMLEALKRVNRYFVDLQNRCALSPSEESVWKEVSRMIYLKNGDDDDNKEV